MKQFALALMFVSVASIAHADIKLPVVTMAVGQYSDWWSSVRFSRNGSGCTEANSRVSNPDGSFRSIKGFAEKSALVGSVVLFTYLTSKSDSKTIRWIGKGTAYMSGGIGAHAAVRNFVQCGF